MELIFVWFIDFLMFTISFVIVYVIMTVVCRGVLGSVLSIPFRGIKLNKYLRITIKFIIIVSVVWLVHPLLNTDNNIFLGGVLGGTIGLLSCFLDGVSVEATRE